MYASKIAMNGACMHVSQGRIPMNEIYVIHCFDNREMFIYCPMKTDAAPDFSLSCNLIFPHFGTNLVDLISCTLMSSIKANVCVPYRSDWPVSLSVKSRARLFFADLAQFRVLFSGPLNQGLFSASQPKSLI